MLLYIREATLESCPQGAYILIRKIEKGINRYKRKITRVIGEKSPTAYLAA